MSVQCVFYIWYVCICNEEILLLCVAMHEKKKISNTEQVYFPFGRPGGGAPNRLYHCNQTETSHGVRSYMCLDSIHTVYNISLLSPYSTCTVLTVILRNCIVAIYNSYLRLNECITMMDIIKLFKGIG